MIIIELIIGLLGVVAYFVFYDSFSYAMLVASLVILICAIVGPVIMVKQFEEAEKRLNNGKIEKTHIIFSDNIVMDEGKVHLEFEYSQIKKIVKTKNLIALMLGHNSYILLIRSEFTKGMENDFIKFIENKIK